MTQLTLVRLMTPAKLMKLTTVVRSMRLTTPVDLMRLMTLLALLALLALRTLPANPVRLLGLPLMAEGKRSKSAVVLPGTDGRAIQFDGDDPNS